MKDFELNNRNGHEGEAPVLKYEDLYRKSKNILHLLALPGKQKE